MKQPPPPPRSRADLALILGGAACVWDDVGSLLGLLDGAPWPGLIMAVNDIGVHWPGRLDHWVSLHPNKLRGKEIQPNWVEQRRRLDHPGGFVTWAWQDPLHLVDRTCEIWGGGSSGLHGMTVAYHVGACKQVLCGIPMSETPHFHDDHNGEAWRHADHHWRIWNKPGTFPSDLQARSMSGRTRQLFGPPTKEWILEVSWP